MGTPLAVTLGEPSGVGPDLILQLFVQRVVLNLVPFIVYGNIEFVRARAKRLGLGVEVRACQPEDAVAAFETELPMVDIGGDIPDQPGEADTKSAPMVIEAIAQAVADVRSGRCSALVTAPIHKASLYGAGFDYPGHTEYLAALCANSDDVPTPVMMLVHNDYRVVPLSIHVPLKDVAGLVTEARIIEVAEIVVANLQTRFGIAAPKLAVAGLNPHAGEGGTMGLEDRDIIVPAVAALTAKGIDAQGPLPADTLFHPPHWRRFNAVIAMYHDQALIPIKTLAFDEGVNVTLGLPIIRTSPDHGTAFDLAGTGKASSKSLLAALKLAAQMAGRTS